MAEKINTQQFEEQVLKANGPVLVDFYADWCGPCQMMLPIIDELTGEYDGKMKIVKVNIDEEQELVQRYRVMSVPTFMFFNGGETKGTTMGAMPKEQFKKEMDKYL